MFVCNKANVAESRKPEWASGSEDETGKMKHKYGFLAAAAVLLGMNLTGLDRLGADPVVETPPHNVLHRPMPDTGEWVTWGWTGDNARYIRAEREVFKAYAAAAKKDPQAGSPELPKSVLDFYGAVSCRNTSDPLAGFKWAYADMMRVPVEGHVDGTALRVVQGIDPGNVREYTRVRYCLTLLSEPNKNHDSINKVAERLLKTNPKDDYVRQLYIYDLVNNEADISKALKLAHEGVERQPEDAQAHSTLAYVYENQFFSSRQSIDRDNSIREYRRYLTLAPGKDGFRNQATYLISALAKEPTK